MNRRIRELIEQAGMTLKPRELFDDDEPNGYLVSDDDYVRANPQAVRVFLDGGLEKFAELIVKECGRYLDSPEFIGRRDLDWSIVLNEYFGVKE